MQLGSKIRRLLELASSSTGRLYLLHRVVIAASFGRARIKKYYILAQPVSDGDLTPARRGRTIVVRELPATDLAGRDLGRPAAVIRRRLEAGGRCLTAEKDGQLLGFQWFTLQSYEEDEVRCVYELLPEHNCAWDYDIYVIPTARALPVFTRLWDHTNRLLRVRGVAFSLSRVDALSGRSLRSHGRLDARIVCSLFFLVVGPLQLALMPFKPWLHLTGPRGQGPTIQASRMALQRQTRIT